MADTAPNGLTSPGTTMPSPPAAQNSHLANLPREVIDNVAKYLPTPAFNNMRLTCKLVENKLFEYWSNCFFRKKQFSEFVFFAMGHFSWSILTLYQ